MPIHPPAHDPHDFAQRLKEAMTDVGHNTGRGAGTGLAKRHKTSVVTANAWLNGTHMPSPERARLLAADYSVRFEWLYFGQWPKRDTTQHADDGGPYVDMPPLALTPRELALIRHYRMSEEGLQDLVDKALEPAAKARASRKK